MKKTMTLLGCAFALSGLAETHILEAERFENRGGWKIESQYHAQLGSSYLIAHGLGRSVADASTTFTVEKAGQYKAYVLTKNWISAASSEAGTAEGGAQELRFACRVPELRHQLSRILRCAR